MSNASKIRTDRTSLRSPYRPSLRQRWQGLRNLVAVPLRMRQRENSHRQEPRCGTDSILRLQTRWSQRFSSGRVSQEEQQINGRGFSFARNECVAALYDLDQHAAAVQQFEARGLPHLWRSGNSCLRRMATQFRGVLPRHGPDLAIGLNHRSHRQQRQLRAWQLPLVAQRGAMENAPLARSEASA